MIDDLSFGSLIRFPETCRKSGGGVIGWGACSGVIQKKISPSPYRPRIPPSTPTRWSLTLNPKFVPPSSPPHCTTDGSRRKRLEWMPPSLAPAARLTQELASTRRMTVLHPKFVPLVSPPRCVPDDLCRQRVESMPSTPTQITCHWTMTAIALGLTLSSIASRTVTPVCFFLEAVFVSVESHFRPQVPYLSTVPVSCTLRSAAGSSISRTMHPHIPTVAFPPAALVSVVLPLSVLPGFVSLCSLIPAVVELDRPTDNATGRNS